VKYNDFLLVVFCVQTAVWCEIIEYMMLLP